MINIAPGVSMFLGDQRVRHLNRMKKSKNWWRNPKLSSHIKEMNDTLDTLISLLEDKK